MNEVLRGGAVEGVGSRGAPRWHRGPSAARWDDGEVGSARHRAVRRVLTQCRAASWYRVLACTRCTRAASPSSAKASVTGSAATAEPDEAMAPLPVRCVLRDSLIGVRNGDCTGACGLAHGAGR